MPVSDAQIVRNLVVVVARKLDYAKAVLADLEGNLRRLDEAERQAFTERFVEAVAELEPHLFTTETEEASRTLNPRTRLEELRLDQIWKGLKSELAL